MALDFALDRIGEPAARSCKKTANQFFGLTLARHDERLHEAAQQASSLFPGFPHAGAGRSDDFQKD